MAQPELVIPVADLERGPKHAQFVLSEAWLRRTLADTDATPVAPGSVDVTLTKNGTNVLVRGHLSVDLTMPCVVTLDPVQVPVRTEIVLMLAPQGGAGSEHEAHLLRRKARPAKADPRPETGKSGANRAERSKSLGKGDGRWEETPELSDETAGQDTYDGHEIQLDGFVREFLILELPMFPRRSDLPTDGPAANPPLPADRLDGGDKPLDPRLSPLAELKSRLEKIKKE